MQITSKKETIKISKPSESLEHNKLIQYPFYVERYEDSKSITWFGININYTYNFSDKTWKTHLGEFCDVPIYEQLYQQLK